MSRKKVLLILAVVLLATAWVSYRIISEREKQVPAEWPEAGGEDDSPIEQVEPENGEKDAPGEVGLQYLGHSCFLLELDGIHFLLDPYSPRVGYGELEVEADVITVSHEHMDHNYVEAAPGARVIRGLTADGLGWEDVSVSLGRVRITGLPTYHDDASGRLRGRNMAFIFQLDDLKVVHLGDLGHFLNETQAEKLQGVDLLLVPVGGHYTIDARQARELIEVLDPAIAVPMHCRTEATRNWPMELVKEFTEQEDGVKKIDPGMVILKPEDWPEKGEIWVLEPEPPNDI